MTDISEKHYSIDAGIGEKMDGCPYSLFEDGHDVKDYIIPPKGYTFKGFRFEPSPNKIYDGKLVAQFEKEPFKERMAPLLHVLAWVFIAGIIIGLITILTVGIFKPQKTSGIDPNPIPEATTPIADTMATDNNMADITTTEPIQASEQIVESQNNNEEAQAVAETPAPVATDDNTQFKQTFWALIHQQEMAMDAYDGLYKQYKGKVSGDEYDYLRFTILKDASTYKEWIRKLRKIPSDQLDKLNSVETFKNKLKDIK